MVLVALLFLEMWENLQKMEIPWIEDRALWFTQQKTFREKLWSKGKTENSFFFFIQEVDLMSYCLNLV